MQRRMVIKVLNTCKKKRISLNQFAKSIGVQPATLYNIVSGKTKKPNAIIESKIKKGVN